MRAWWVALALGAGPAAAQDAAQASAPACAALPAWIEVNYGLAPAGGAPPAAGPDGWCEVRDAVVGDAAEGPVIYRVDVLRWRGEGLDRLALRAGLPTAFEAEMRGFRVQPVTGQPALDYLYEVQGAGAGVDGRVSVAWDAGSRELRLLALDLDFPGRSAVRASATVAGLDLSSTAALQLSAGQAGLTALSAEVVLDGLFESWLLLPLGAALLDGAADPAAEVARLKDLAQAEIARVPASILPDPGRAEAAAFVESLPNPLGTLRLGIEDQGPGIGAARLARFAATGLPSPADLWPALEGVVLDVGWEPLAPTEE